MWWRESLEREGKGSPTLRGARISTAASFLWRPPPPRAPAPISWRAPWALAELQAADDHSREADPPAAALPRSGPLAPVAVLSYDRAAKRRQVEPGARAKSIASLAVIANDFLTHSPVFQQVVREEGSFSESSPSLVAMCTPKSTPTLLKRTCSLRLYRAWFLTADYLSDSFLTEPAIYGYFRFLHIESAPATRASSLKQAVNFLSGLFSIKVESIQRSTRVHGLSIAMLRTRAMVRQRSPLSVAMVRALERVVMEDAGKGEDNAIIAGIALFTLFARARIGDISRCPYEPSLDTSCGTGYVETRFVNHKTARPGSRLALPITATAFGISGEPWAETWLTARRNVNLSAERQGTLLPARAPDGWHSVPFLTQEFAAALRALLLDLGFDTDQISDIGAHSLKVTCLAWAAKFGVARDVRRMLGYHLQSGDKSLESYSRDSMAGPLRDLDKVLSAIMDKSFDPDATRSGTFTPSASKPTSTPPSSTCSSSRSSSSSSCSSSITRPKVVETFSGEVVMNVATHFHHLADTEAELRCGKPWPLNFARLEAVPAGGRLCSRCF